VKTGHRSRDNERQRVTRDELIQQDFGFVCDFLL
jgi:hypothetical protein